MMVIRLYNVLVAALLRLTLPLYLQYRVYATLQAIGHMIVDRYCALELHVISQAAFMLT